VLNSTQTVSELSWLWLLTNLISQRIFVGIKDQKGLIYLSGYILQNWGESYE